MNTLFGLDLRIFSGKSEENLKGGDRICRALLNNEIVHIGKVMSKGM